MSDELKPCRFCNGPAIPVKQFKNNVTCGDKHCPGCIVVQEPERWNHRPIEDALRARIKELEQAMPNPLLLTTAASTIEACGYENTPTNLTNAAEKIKKAMKL